MRLPPLKKSKLTKFLFFIAIFLFPYSFYRPFAINFTFSDGFLFLCLLLIIFFRYIKVPLANIMATSLLLLGYFISVFKIIDVSAYLLGMLQYFVVFFILPLVVYNVIRTKKDLQQAIFVYFIALFFSFLYNVGILLDIFPKLYGTFRLGGTFVNPNALAKVAGVSMVGAFVLVTSLKGSIYKKIFLSIHFILAGFILVASGSFGGIFFTAITLFAYIIFILIQQLKKFKIGGAIKIVSVSIIFLIILSVFFRFYAPPAYEKRLIKSSSLETTGSAEIKISQMLHGINLFLNAPLIGVGCEQMKHHNISQDMTMHNFYIIIANEGGILSLIGLLIFLSLIIRRGIFLEDVILRRFFCFTILSFLLNALTSANLYSRLHWFPIIFVFYGVASLNKSIMILHK